MTDDEMWSFLRTEAAVTDVDADTAAAIQRRAHERLRHPHQPMVTAVRAVEAFVVTSAVIAQLMWAWRVVLG